MNEHRVNNAELCCEVKGMGAADHHLAARVLRKTLHHGVHLVKLLESSLHLRVELFVFSVLVIKHSTVLVPFIIRPDGRILTAGWR